jgi:formylglycine-generating enzyme required for sulfatase activity/serine/threonine protein kinase
MPVSIGEFVKRLDASGILTDADLQFVQNEATAEGLDGDADAFVKRLHQQGRLTAYQAQALWKGKGDTLAFGNYVIEAELGRGGMGVVLKARHKRMQRHVAIKVLPAAMVNDSAAVARFQREVVAAAQLNHPNIVGAHDADEINGQHILVMEYVDGRDLSSVVKKQGPLPVAKAVDCIKQAARGLEFAHERGVIHRDVKPANLLLNNKAMVKILDMGLARFSDAANVETQAELTGSGTIMGTVDYMSPEQALSTKSADARSDIYSLGITLYYLLTGKPAYTGDSLMARMMAHAQQPIPSLLADRPDVPAGVQAVFAKMVAKRPADRYQSMAEVLVDLESCLTQTFQEHWEAIAPDGSSDDLLDFLQSQDGSGTSGHRPVETAVAATRTPTMLARADEQTQVYRPTSDTFATLPSSPTTRRGQQPRKRSPLADKRVLGSLGGCGFLILAAVVFFFQTPNGTLRVEINDPEVEVAVQGTTIVLKGANKKDITLKPGEYILHVNRGDFEFDTKSLHLKKGQTVAVNVELVDGQVQVASGGTVIGSKALTAASVTSVIKTGLNPDSNTGWHGWPADAPKPAIAPFDAEQAKKHQEEWAAYLKVPVEYTNSIGMKMQLIPPGEFLMGSSEDEIASLLENAKAKKYYIQYVERIPTEGPQHHVTLTKPFRLSAYEVNRGQFRQFVEATGYKTDAEKDGKGGYGFKDGQWVQGPEFLWNTNLGFEAEQTDNHPVVNVSWNDAVSFCEWLTRKDGAAYRLPTEAEWEFACRAGNPGKFSFGNDEANLAEYGWYLSQGGRNTGPVGQKASNSFGIFDLHGNVLEWCHDVLGPYTAAHVIDPFGMSEGSSRALRGGAFYLHPENLRSACRYSNLPIKRSSSDGFRVVLTVDSVR